MPPSPSPSPCASPTNSSSTEVPPCPVCPRPEGVQKNYQKWKEAADFGSILYGLLPMKMMSCCCRDSHNVPQLQALYPSVGLCIDFSLEHNPYSLEGTGIEYFKLSTVPKALPSEEAVKVFLEKVDGFQREHPDKLIAVHCHYGFNRTGFLVCSYLVERKGLDVEEAMDLFAEARPPGIRHEHFRQELRNRYKKTESGEV